jgi:hypothetical protein
MIQECLCQGDTYDVTLWGKSVIEQSRGHQIFHLRTAALNKLCERFPVQVIARAFNLKPKDTRHVVKPAM